MCWSAEVSMAFACLDLVCVGGLLLKKYYCCAHSGTNSLKNRKDTFYGTYAAILSAVTVQEWAQYAVWKSGGLYLRRLEEEKDEASSSCTGADMFFSLAASGVAACIPFIIIMAAASCRGSKTNSGHDDTQRYQDCETNDYDVRGRYLRNALYLWIALVSVLVSSVIRTETYCIELGQNHHQVWIFSLAVYRIGGYPLYFLMLLVYILSGILALLALPLPPSELQWVCGIALGNCLVAHIRYSWTLEASSIWCWSAFSLGFYFAFLCLTQ